MRHTSRDPRPAAKMHAASPWFRDMAIPPHRAVGSALPSTPFTANHRELLKAHQLDRSACIIYDADGAPREALILNRETGTRTRRAL